VTLSRRLQSCCLTLENSMLGVYCYILVNWPTEFLSAWGSILQTMVLLNYWHCIGCNSVKISVHISHSCMLSFLFVLRSSLSHNGVGTNFGGLKGRERGMVFLGRGQSAPPHQEGLRERCKKLPLRGPGGTPTAEGLISCILSRQIAFSSISVRVAYSLHG